MHTVFLCMRVGGSLLFSFISEASTCDGAEGAYPTKSSGERRIFVYLCVGAGGSPLFQVILRDKFRRVVVPREHIGPNLQVFVFWGCSPLGQRLS